MIAEISHKRCVGDWYGKYSDKRSPSMHTRLRDTDHVYPT